uniref:Fc of IgE receptor Ia n=1 Tax=Rousettus aegyptiacus TaxID=9407 RepID=A0A7J8BED9_ROUAE|nr:Fc fragment of IgE receptor Ia [Rousettus aegyptiacus]
MSTSMGGPALLWIALLLFSPDGMSSVNSTKWTHNNTMLEVKTPSLDIVNATFQDSGAYRCWNKNLIPSQPVYLEVFSDWLLIQSSTDVVLEGESFLIRCHGWMNQNVYKVIYYKNGKAIKYWYENHNISITNATIRDSGTYYCKGILWQINYTSDPLEITVKKDPITAHQSNYWLQFLIPLLVVILFAVDTSLFISTRRQFTFLLKIKRTRKGNKLMDPHPKTDPQNN